MYKLIKDICEKNDWVFQYSRRDFTNLYDGEEQVGNNTPLLFLDPIQITESFDETNTLDSTSYEGQFMVLVSSDIDEEDYDYRYQTYIKPIIDSTLSIIKNEIICGNIYDINNWRITEVINAFDFNADGVIVTYNLDAE